MKRIFAGLTVVLLSALTLTASAQNGGGNADRMAQYRQMLKDSLQLTDVQCDSVMAVRQEMGPQMRTIYQDQTMSADDKTAKMKALNDAANARYAKFLTPAQIAKLNEMQRARMMRMRQNGGGGGR